MKRRFRKPGPVLSVAPSYPNAQRETGVFRRGRVTTAQSTCYANLFFQGNLNQAAIDGAIAQVQKLNGRHLNTTEALVSLLSGDQYYG
ncbi:MAG TPA: hypothetical protein VHC22_22105 [Pirellulales bacterium]|nr:hypothetical protein [Pirellulales bacterium]